MTWIDFTDCEVDRLSSYGGSDKKRGIIYNGKRYMLKLSDRIPDEKQNSLNSSYSNSSFSEYVGCHILQRLGFIVQNTLLGTIKLTSSKGEEKVYPVVACENFIPEGKQLIEFKVIENALLNIKPPRVPHIEHIYEILDNENVYFSKSFGRLALNAYWDLFIVDALLGNFDRHANNWGYLIDEKSGEITLAPIYDCGSCLYPQMSDEAGLRIIQDPAEVQMRIDKFPLAALEIAGNKVNYREYISSFINPDCTAALLRIAPRINIDEINALVQSMPELTAARKKFYCTMLTERYKQIIEGPYRRAHAKYISQLNKINSFETP